ncbi:mycothiol system anti-sigma-R factor [Actinomycetaceae bacterium L2_0104]
MSQEEMAREQRDRENGRIEKHGRTEDRGHLDEPQNIDEIVTQVERKLRDFADSDCSCEELSGHLFEFLDAQMPQEQAARLRRHMETCPHCNRLMEAETHVREMLKRSCCESAPSTLRIKITQQIAVYRSAT